MASRPPVHILLSDRAMAAGLFTQLTRQPGRLVRVLREPELLLGEAESAPGLVVTDLAIGRDLLLLLCARPGQRVQLVADRLSATEAVALIQSGVDDLHFPPHEVVAMARRIEGRLVELAREARVAQRIELARRQLGSLTPREREVVERLAAGCSSKEVARELALSPRTVEVHRARIMRRGGFGNIAGLLRAYWTVELSRE